MLRLRHLSGALLAALALSAAAQAGTTPGTTDFNKVVVFGDSLSDNGNLSLASGSQQPMRFTTNPGEVAVEHVADHFGITLAPALLGGTDFAFGGAGVVHNAPGVPPTVPTLTAQITSYLAAAGSLDTRTLYTVWGGANDIFWHATQAGMGAETSDQAQAAIGAAAAQELNLLGQMGTAGARYVVVFNLPDIGLTPSAANQGPAGIQALRGLSMVYNGVLDGGLDSLSDHGLNVVPVNVYALFNEVVANPAAFGFSNITTPACLTGPASAPAAKVTSVQCGPAGSGAPYTYADGTNENYLFADNVHPTTAAHEMLGQYVIAELSAPGQASMLAEAPLASANAHMSLLRQQMRIDQAGGTTRVFVGADYGRQRFDASRDSPRMRSRNVNLVLGVDASTGADVNAGVALGVARNHADVGSGGFRLDSIIGSGYLQWHHGGAYAGADVGFAKLSYKDIQRRFQLGALTRTETGDADGSQIMAGVNAGWWSHFGNWRTGPVVRAQWQRIAVDGYSEEGEDSSAMWFGAQQRYALVGTFGWQVQGNWKAGASTWHPYLSVAWNHDSRADTHKVRAGLNGMQGSFALTGFTPDGNWASADVGLAADFSRSVSGWIAYQGRFGDSNQRLDSLNVGLKIVF